MNELRDSTARIRVDEVQIRPKSLTPARLAPVRCQARRLTAEMLEKALGEEGEKVARIARVLTVSESLVHAWLDPDAKQQMDLADIVALELGGAQAIAYAYLDKVARWLYKRMAPGKTPAEHAADISQAALGAHVALTGDATRASKIHALRAVKLAADRAMADLEEVFAQ